MLPNPRMRIDFLSKESRLACPVHVPFGAQGEIGTRTGRGLKSVPLLLGYLGKGAPGRSCTDTERGLSPLPLRLGYGSESGPGGRTCTRTGRGLSSLPLHWATPGKKSGAPGRNFACNLRVRSAALYTLSYGSLTSCGLGWIRTINLPIQRRTPDSHRVNRFCRPMVRRLCLVRQKVGRPTGFAPVRRFSQNRMLLLHHGLHLISGEEHGRLGCVDTGHSPPVLRSAGETPAVRTGKMPVLRL